VNEARRSLSVIASTAFAELEDVTKDYPASRLGLLPTRALAGVSLRIEAGEVLGLVGPNRAGKTTLVKILLSLSNTTSGRVNRFGLPTSDRSTLGRVGYMHEAPSFPRYLTARELLNYYGALSHTPERELRQRIPQLLERVGLADRSGEAIARFSKGMIQRLGLAQALINTPDLLILDEPTEGLDLTGRQLVSDIVREQVGQGRSALMISHVVADAARLFDRIAVLVDGRLAFLGPTSALTRDRHAESSRSVEETLGKLYTKGSL
jgi:ABC-2 type transport system ATP-binding protein